MCMDIEKWKTEMWGAYGSYRKLWERKSGPSSLGFDTSQGKDQWFYWAWSVRLRLAG